MSKSLRFHLPTLVAGARLRIQVHIDAFRTDPLGYLTAHKWRLLGKRVRARAQLSRLLSRSPSAYSLWSLQRQRSAGTHSPVDAAHPFLALIDCTQTYSEAGLAATVRSVNAEGTQAYLLGSIETPTLADLTEKIDWRCPPWIFLMSPGDELAVGATSAYRRVASQTKSSIIYADDDITLSSHRIKPYFKPKWNAELFRYQDYISGACAVHPRREDLSTVPTDMDWSRSLLERLIRHGEPVHLPEVLHHRRSRNFLSSPPRPNLIETCPTVSIVIPTRNRVDLLKTCFKGVRSVDYPKIELIIIDNDSDDLETIEFLIFLREQGAKVVSFPGPFNYSQMNNQAIREATGEFLCLLNNDVEMIDDKWLRIMVSQAARSEVGAVGARLLYPDGRIQHAGVVVGVGNAAGHSHRFIRPEDEGYFYRHNLPQFTMAVTAACLVVARDKFLVAGGLDAKNFPVAFNDVDLCLRLTKLGWQSLYEPRATLIHHESVSRGLDQDPIGAARFRDELAALQRLWRTHEIVDPFHHPQLSRETEQFSIAL
jgi:GT2 family glycosyltransferase